jgi:hypothetical protein
VPDFSGAQRGQRNGTQLGVAIAVGEIYGRLMDSASSAINRAYCLARTGRYTSVMEIEQRMKAEHYLDIRAHLRSRTLRHGLNKLCTAVRKRTPRSLVMTQTG